MLLPRLLALLPGAFAPHRLSLVQMERLRRLEDRSRIKFDPEDPEHQSGLRRLWGYAFPDIPYPRPTLKSPQWKEMG